MFKMDLLITLLGYKETELSKNILPIVQCTQFKLFSLFRSSWYLKLMLYINAFSLNSFLDMLTPYLTFPNLLISR